jgi:hypothetical protein
MNLNDKTGRLETLVPSATPDVTKRKAEKQKKGNWAVFPPNSLLI